MTCYLHHAGFLLGLFFDPEDGGGHVPLKHQSIFIALHGVISEMTELFKTTTVSTSNPIYINDSHSPMIICPLKTVHRVSNSLL
jgi:hypothetical protein